MELRLEVREQEDETVCAGPVALPLAVGGDYWAYRVAVSERQAVVGFPKFSTIGIGFAVEGSDWNTNLPYTFDAERIYEHIEQNKGDGTISRQTCITAIRMIQERAARDGVPGVS